MPGKFVILWASEPFLIFKAYDMNINLKNKICGRKFFAIAVFAMGLFMVSVTSCTSSRWVVREMDAVDQNDYEVVDSKPYLMQSGEPTPENPVLELSAYDQVTYRYKEKIQTERYIQEYRPRWFFTGVSLASSALIFYSAHSDQFVEDLSGPQSLFFNLAGGALALAPFISMRPKGEPIETGETQLKRVTGSREVSEKEQTGNTIIKKIRLSLVHSGDSLINNREIRVQDNKINLNLVELIDTGLFDGVRADTVELAVGFRESTFSYRIPISKFLVPYARVSTDFSELHNSPSSSSDNILTDLARNSMLEFVETVEEDWYRVKFGVKDTYIEREDVELVWRSASFEQRESIVTLANIPFGDIDVESNVPVLNSSSPEGMGLIISGEEYENNLGLRKYAQRDGRLIKLYLEQALGYPAQDIHHISNYNSNDEISRRLGQIEARMRSDTSELFVFISGHATVRETEGEYHYYLVPTDQENYQETEETNLLDLGRLLRRLSQLPTRQTLITAELDFHYQDPMLQDSENLEVIRPLAAIARNLTEYHSRSAVIFSSSFDQSPNVYYQKGGQDKKHRIFPYYLAQSLQLRNTEIEDIMQYLERNINYTSRKLHDLPQNPQFFGNENINLTTPAAP